MSSLPIVNRQVREIQDAYRIGKLKHLEMVAKILVNASQDIIDMLNGIAQAAMLDNANKTNPRLMTVALYEALLKQAY